ncbi:hypothetical protein [Gulosibacter molinativorax]|uniref:hypothetical protein n=1 Tax=Gulosibacter molinativorax TaxID=256821 RepID=UPI0015E7807A|nr:hypothetical protein [Gulosibacter molinativorax]QUY63147.1 Putative membrane protein [Gulosibacter molinativorax]
MSSQRGAESLGAPSASSTSASTRGPSWRLAWLVPAAVALLLGLDAGLLLLGVPAPLTTERLPNVHGMLLVLGFVGTLIALERATALGRWWGFVAPALLGLGGILLVTSAVPLTVGKAVLVAGAAAFMLVYVPLWRRQYDAPLLVQLLGAALGLCGAIIWLVEDGMARVVPWLIGFVVLTIAAERVELAHITMGPRAGGVLLGHAWGVTGSLVVGLVMPDAGAILLGISLLSLCGWLIRHDIARRTIRSTGVTRYMAACILAGYAWLTVAGIVLLLGDPSGHQPAYDAVTHSIFLGYTFSMIMAHATTILPAVLHISLPYRPAFWGPIALLQLALVVRLWLGDALGLTLGWQIGGGLGVAALLLFAATAIVSALLGAPGGKASRASNTDLGIGPGIRTGRDTGTGAGTGRSSSTARQGDAATDGGTP